MPPKATIARMPPNHTVDRILSQARSGKDGSDVNTPKDVINLDIPELKHLITHRRDAKVLYQAQNIAEDHSTLEFVLSSDEGQTEIVVSIHQAQEDALEALRAHLMGYHLPVDKIFSAPPDGHSHGSYCLVSEVENLPNCTMLWVRGNIFTRISGPMTHQQLDESFIHPIDAHYTSHSRPRHDGLELPEVEQICAPANVRKGEEFVVRATVAGAGATAVSSGDNDKVILLRAETESQEYHFRALETGKETVVFAFAHITSGHVVSRGVEVEVVDK